MMKWKAILGLVIVYIIIIFQLNWAWGIVFLIYILPDMFSGVTHFVEPISRDDNPILFWIIILSWLLMSIYSFVDGIWPGVIYGY
jgi:hypothetical protein